MTSRTLFSWTLHAIVYFWLFPSFSKKLTPDERAALARYFEGTL
ncbi:MAG: hypothetical protein ACJ8D5_08325 [Sphingomicrobium sp.]